MGLPEIVQTSRAIWRSGIELFAALGHGRSYGEYSSLLFRTLPGILDCGIWKALKHRATVPTSALITDVGNDILYGHSPAEIIHWVDECILRLQRCTPDILITDLPMAGIRNLSRGRFLLFRTAFFPRCRLAQEEVLCNAEQVSAGMAELAQRRGSRFIQMPTEWYGFDPIHIRRSRRRAVWHQVLCEWQQISCPIPARASVRESLQLRFMRPERRWIMNKEQFTKQTGQQLECGGTIWLY